LIYAMSADTRGLPSVVDVLSEVINRPSILPEEVCVELYRINIKVSLFFLKTKCDGWRARLKCGRLLIPDRVKSKTIKYIFVASLLSMQR